MGEEKFIPSVVNVAPFVVDDGDNGNSSNSNNNEDSNNSNNNNNNNVDKEDTMPPKGELEVANLQKIKRVSWSEPDVNPWDHRLNASFLDKLQIIIMSITIAPIRFLCIITLLSFMNLLSRLGLVGITPERLEESPLTGWRWLLQSLIWGMSRGLFFGMGIHWISVKGEQAPSTAAPVIVVAPHSTIVDALSIVMCGATPVAKQELSKTPLIGTIGVFLQVLFVKREKASSRRRALEQIKRHAISVRASKWKRPLLLFPEGTCTNGRALVHFKAGAFNSGLPVQPVLLRFPSLPDTLTWTWDQSYGAMGCLWLTLCQFNTRAQVEYLPVCVPEESEKEDARTFAASVRVTMAEALKIPIVNQRLEDAKELLKTIKNNNSANTDGEKDKSEKNVEIDPESSSNTTERRRKKSSFIETLTEDLHIDLEEEEEGHYDPGKKGYSYVDFAGNLNLM